mmetsp:Transcript_123562/g.394734  ORF Transcript_123562/g.394734 Transcript_123562/m.394734 type:complete len:474 (-) Transcript_123562:45-1466(-)
MLAKSSSPAGFGATDKRPSSRPGSATGSRPGSGGSGASRGGGLHRSASTSAAAAAALGGGAGRRYPQDYYESVRQDPTNRALVLRAADRNRYAMLHAVPDLRKDREIVLASMKHCGDSLLLTPLNNDKEVVLEAVSQLGESLRYADKRLLNDREVVLAAVQQDGLALRYAKDKLKDDREIVMAAVRQTGRALRHASERWRKDLDVVMVALQSNNAALAYVESEKHESVYGIGLNNVVLFQPLPSLSKTSDWVEQSKGPLKSITIEGATIYAVKDDMRIYRQMLVTMNTESQWIGPLSGDEVLSVAVAGGYVYGIKNSDKRVYKQVLVQMTTENKWDGPVSDEMELSSISIYEDQMYGVGIDGKFYRQNVFAMCNNSTLFAVGADNKIHWQALKDLHPKRQWMLTSQGDITALVICNRDLKEACQDMLEADWRAKGAHLERRAAAAKARSSEGAARPKSAAAPEGAARPKSVGA